MATSGDSKQIYNWNTMHGLGCAPALSWLPYIQDGIPLPPHPLTWANRMHPLAPNNKQEGRSCSSILASEYLAEHCTCWISNEARLMLRCLPVCMHARACVPVDLAAAPQKVGLRACYSRPSVWPPLAHKHKWAEGQPLWQKAPQQTKPLNILSKSIKASRDRPGLIVCVWYYRTLQGCILVKN